MQLLRAAGSPPEDTHKFASIVGATRATIIQHHKAVTAHLRNTTLSAAKAPVHVPPLVLRHPPLAQLMGQVALVTRTTSSFCDFSHMFAPEAHKKGKRGGTRCSPSEPMNVAASLSWQQFARAPLRHLSGVALSLVVAPIHFAYLVHASPHFYMFAPQKNEPGRFRAASLAAFKPMPSPRLFSRLPLHWRRPLRTCSWLLRSSACHRHLLRGFQRQSRRCLSRLVLQRDCCPKLSPSRLFANRLARAHLTRRVFRGCDVVTA